MSVKAHPVVATRLLIKMQHELITTALLYITSYFAIINPLGVMPVFMTMTSSLDEKERKRTAIKAVITAFFILITFALGGQLLFKVFGISVNSFRMVGGIIFFIMGYDMLQARVSKMKMDDDMIKNYVDDISITPLAIPMIAGPGAITNSIVLMEDSHTLALKIILLVSIIVILIATLLILLGSGKLIKVLGETGNKIMTKLMGLIMMVIAVEFFFAGLKPIVQNMLLP